MKKIVNKFYDIREGEWQNVSAFFAMSFLLIVLVYFLKPARDSLFLIQLGAERLPYVFIAIAVLSVPITGIVIRTVEKYKSVNVFPATILSVIAQLFILRLFMTSGSQWVYVVFYLWVGVFGILVVSQFWLFANEMFDAARSKRVFPLLNLGAISGSIAGSYTSSALISSGWLATEDLLYAGIGTSGVLLAIAMFLRSRIKNSEVQITPKRKKKMPGLSRVKDVFESRYHLMIAGIIGSAMLVSTLADYQVKAVAEESFPDKESLTSFMGSFYGMISVAALFIQIAVSGRLLKKIGLGAALSFRPAGILVAAVLLAIEPVLAFAVLLGGVDTAARYSIDKTGREILFLPIRKNIKERIKLVLDVITDRFFKGFAGFILLVMVVFLEFTIVQTAVSTIVFSALWLLLSYRAQRAYINEFRKSLYEHDFTIDSENQFDLNESQTVVVLKDLLASDSPEAVIRALKLMEGNDAAPFVDSLQKLISHPKNEIRLNALQLLSTLSKQYFVEDSVKLLKDDDPEIQMTAMNYICTHAPEKAEKILQTCLDSGSISDKAAALGCMGTNANDSEMTPLKNQVLAELMDNDHPVNPAVRAQVARALSSMGEDKARKYLPQLLKDPSEKVRREAVKSMGKLRHPDFISLLVNTLNERKLAAETIESIVRYGKEYLPEFTEHLHASKENPSLFRSLIKAISNISSQDTADLLFSLLEEESNNARRFILIKGVNRLHANNEKLNFSRKKIEAELDKEFRKIYLFKNVLNQLPPEKRFDLLKKVTDERVEQIIEHVFRLLGLIFNYRDLRGALQSYKSTNREYRSASVEFMDNLLKGETSKIAMPIIDSHSLNYILTTGEKHLSISLQSYEEAMVLLLAQDDEWLKAATLFGITPSCPAPLPEKLKEHLKDPSPVVSETSELIFQTKFR
ncbi:MAG: Npt1/Npt2 family nucleotide transporter [Cryomorphaceae bacterium]|nr:HEAT repeat domain-containing protein [Flavobacteriales bacterium]